VSSGHGGGRRSGMVARHVRGPARRAVALAALGLMGACSAGDDSVAGTTTSTSTTTAPPPVEAVVWPVHDWEPVDPTDAGVDPAMLAAMAEEAGGKRSRCLVVTKDGRLVHESYWGGWDATTEQEAFSVTKSITSALVGIAADRGLLEVDQPVADFVEEWRGTPSGAVTIRNLLSNDSGRFHDVPTDYGAMAGRAEDKTAFAVGLEQQHDPGTVWVYDNSAIQVLEQVIEEATGMPTTEWARTQLFEPLGMRSHLRSDAAGNALVFMGAQASCRDLARFGLLWLRGGEWDGEQIVSRGWVEKSVTPSQALNPGYGFLWWLDAEGGDDYAALGLDDQVVAVFPDEGLVVTRLGGPGFGRGDIVEHVEGAS
jgi:CubicO group peptidase (beta-lactamase class C family)